MSDQTIAELSEESRLRAEAANRDHYALLDRVKTQANQITKQFDEIAGLNLALTAKCAELDDLKKRMEFDIATERATAEAARVNARNAEQRAVQAETTLENIQALIRDRAPVGRLKMLEAIASNGGAEAVGRALAQQ